MGFYEIMDLVFSPLMGLPNILIIICISVFVGLISTIAYKFLTDQPLMKEYKEELKRSQKAMKENKDNPEKMREWSNKSMKANMKYMSQTMKPMLVTIIPFIIIFRWLGHTFGDTVIIPLPFTLPLIGASFEWLGTYVIFSLILTTGLRKLLKVV